MRSLLLIIFTLLGGAALAQTTVKIHDLKSLTDSSGTTHLFYRIYDKNEGSETFTDHIYHYNTATQKDSIFIRSSNYYWGTYTMSDIIRDYKFFDNDPTKYIVIEGFCDHECSDYVRRNDDLEGMGGLFMTIEYLNVEGTDTGRVYVRANSETIIGRNGGRDWPIADAVDFREIPDSSKLYFPLISLSPYDNSLMFGKGYSFGAGSNGFLRSLDKGKTSEFLSDTLLPNHIYFDSDSSTVYIIDRLSKPKPEINCTINICNYGLFVNKNKGSAESWELKTWYPTKADTTTFPNVFVHPSESGRLYVWNADSLTVSDDYGESFKVLVNPTERITGFTATASHEYYSTTSTLYKIEGGNSVKLLSIPVSNETEREFPGRFELLQNYPNPFNPVTTITYRMHTSGVVSIELYTIQGQWVKRLVNDFKTEGQHSFRLNGSDLASGIYILRGRLGEQTETRKITLIK